MTRRVLLAVAVVLLLGYPLAVYYLYGHWRPNAIIGVLALLVAVRLTLAQWAARAWRWRAVAGAVAALLAALLVSWLPPLPAHWVKFYPMAMDILVGGAFFVSLFTRRPLVERFARVLKPELPPQAIRYTRRVTWYWVALIWGVAVASGLTAFASLRLWALFNGLVAYGIFALGFAAEYAVRSVLEKKWQRA